MSGFTHLRPENRAKSLSVVCRVAPCSMASAARAASITSGPGRLTVAHHRLKNLPVAITRLERLNRRLCQPRRHDRRCLVRRQGRSKTCGLVEIRRKANTVIQAILHELAARERGLQPGAARLVHLRPWMGIYSSRFASTSIIGGACLSTCSIRSATSSIEIPDAAPPNRARRH